LELLRGTDGELEGRRSRQSAPRCSRIDRTGQRASQGDVAMRRSRGACSDAQGLEGSSNGLIRSVADPTPDIGNGARNRGQSNIHKRPAGSAAAIPAAARMTPMAPRPEPGRILPGSLIRMDLSLDGRPLAALACSWAGHAIAADGSPGTRGATPTRRANRSRVRGDWGLVPQQGANGARAPEERHHWQHCGVLVVPQA
jgi:hypothetical protein